MIQSNYFYFSILLFGWSNKKFHCHHFCATFINFNFFGQNLKIEIRGQFVNCKNLMGQFVIFLNFWGQIENFGVHLYLLILLSLNLIFSLH